MAAPADSELLRWRLYHRKLKIADRASFAPVAYHPNVVQKRLNDCIEAQALARKPIRLIVLKSRRMGVSTHVQARFTHAACTKTTFHGITGAHLEESSVYLHGMTEKMVAGLPAEIRPAKKIGIQGKRIEFEAGSTLRTFTAGSRDGVGRATGANALHASELAFWPDQKGTLTALMQIVPDEYGTIIVLESTANGIGDEFHQRCELAMNGSGDYEFFFAPWFEFPDYRLSDERTLSILGEAPEWAPREVALLGKGVDENQLAWRRWAILNLCGGDANVFDQEYPDSPGVAFLTSGRPYFDPDQLERVHPVDPKRVGSIEGDPIRGGSSLSFVANRNGPLKIWSAPKPGREYLIFADVAGKVTGLEHDARPLDSKADYCAASVCDRETGEEVAAYHAHIDPDLYGWDLARIGWLYGGAEGKPAMIAVENTGGYGIAPIAVLHRQLSYPNLYVRRKLDTQTGKWSETIGWDTSETTRPVMLSTTRSHLREHPEHFKDDGWKREARVFVVHSNGKPSAASGAHDDRVMARAGVLEVWREHAQRPLRTATKKPQGRDAGSLTQRAPRIS